MTKRKDWTIPEHYDPVVSAKELAGLFDLTSVRIQQLAKEGMPKRSHGKYPLKRCCKWIRDYWRSRATGDDDASAFREAKARKLAAEAQIKEAQLEKLHGNTIPIDAVVPSWDGAAIVAAQAFATFEDRMVMDLFNSKTPEELASKLKAEHDRILTELADADIEIEITD